MLSHRATFIRDAAQLHIWLGQIDEFGTDQVDPAHVYRISAVSEAVRIMADAMEGDGRSLRRSGCEDLSVLTLRLSQDLASALPQRMAEGAAADGAVALTAHLSTVFADVSDALVHVGSGLHGTTPVECGVDVSGPVGHVTRDDMLAFSKRVISVIYQLQDTVLADPEFKAAQLNPSVRDAWATSVMLSTLAAGMADCRLLDLDRMTRRASDVRALSVQAAAHLARVDQLAPNALRGAIAAGRAFYQLQEVADECIALLEKARRNADDTFSTMWRLLSRGKAVFEDRDLLSIVDAPLAIPFVAGPSLQLDMSCAGPLGDAAYAIRDEWVA